MADRIADSAERREALDPERSFIVQAPAGSGKTELLTQRILRLLACVDAPEELVAITFTRKAASEMRGRVLAALHRARDDTPPGQEHERLTWTLARAALEHDRAREWELEDNPGRLRIQTIDSLCAALTRQMPALSGFGAPPGIVEDASDLYLRAARNTIAEVESGQEWSRSIEYLLAHLDNNLSKVEGLIATMLARRDQWLRHVADRTAPRVERSNLEAALGSIVKEALADVRAAVPGEHAGELAALARFAAGKLAEAGEGASPVLACAGLESLPGAEPGDLPVWRGLAALLLTNEGGWRRSINKAIGFPAPSSAREPERKAHLDAMKKRMAALIDGLADEEVLRDLLHRVRSVPPAAYDDDQWQTLQALFELLRMAPAQLRLVFREAGAVDFTGMAQAAIEALGSPEDPTDLALALDYRIRHLLLDEFQDTSFTQYELLERLTAGWEPDDGRTLFAVGDPMQSIYRFREAEVGLFLRARREGIGQVPLTPLTLSVNFRSTAGIVDWVNATFPSVLPPREDLASGAVPYARSQACRAPGAEPAVGIHALVDAGPEVEADRIVALIRDSHDSDPDGRVAILVRSRTHLVAIVPRLRDAGLRFRAIDIEHLGHRPVIQDLLALTRAMLHRADRVAWLAVLRAPWCGLLLSDLYALAGADRERCIPDLMDDEAVIGGLGDDGRRRLQRVREVLATARRERRRHSLRRWVEGVWLALGGPACVTDPTDLEDARVFFELLDRLERGGDLADPERLGDEVSGLFALPDMEADDRLQVMTIHKAKGLEFDTVIVPGLGRTPRSPESRLLMWLERPRGERGDDLLLAPIKGSGREDDPIYRYLRGLDQEKARFEDGRLLYVAATRARERLHLLGEASLNDEGELNVPARTSLLHQLWPVVQDDFVRAAEIEAHEGEAAAVPLPPVGLRRLEVDWALPPGPAAVSPPGPRPPEPAPPAEEPVEFEWAGETARHVGTAVHRLLQYAATRSTEGLLRQPQALRPVCRGILTGLGVPPLELPSAVDRVVEAVALTLRDERGRWILDQEHDDAGSEYALTGILDGQVVSIVIDRTFVDREGTRWIIDYKTGTHSGGDVDEFLDREQTRYRAQLQRYARLMSNQEGRPIRLALYFPLLGGWRSWAFESGEGG